MIRSSSDNEGRGWVLDAPIYSWYPTWTVKQVQTVKRGETGKMVQQVKQVEQVQQVKPVKHAKSGKVKQPVKRVNLYNQ